MTKKRVDWIDIVRGVAIVCVMLGHIDWGENPLCVWIYSFHIPIWFFLSGVLAFHTRDAAKPALSRFIQHKAASLLYPYFTFSLISIAYITVCLGFGRDTVLLLLAMISFLGISGAMWFLPVMFFSSVLFESLGRIKLRRNLLFLPLLALIYVGDRFTPFEYYYAVQRVLIATSFLFLGYYYAAAVAAHQFKKSALLLVGLGMLASNLLLSRTNGLVDLHYATMNNMLRYYLLALLGCVGLCLIISSLTLPGWISGPLSYLGKNSLIILTTHVNLPFISWSRGVFSLLFGEDGLGHRCADDLMILLILLVFEGIVIVFVNRFGKFLLHPKYLKKTETR